MTDDQATNFLELRHAATDRAMIVHAPERRLFAIDGVGQPEAADFRFARQILRDAGERVRQRLRRRQSIEIPATVTESAWWIHPELPVDRMADAFADRSGWHWQQLVEIPAAATDAEAEAAIAEVRRQGGQPGPLIRIVHFTEGQAAQILHVGGSATEADAVRRLYAAVVDAGLRPRGHLHEIDLVDPDRVPAERARSIIRLPIAPLEP